MTIQIQPATARIAIQRMRWNTTTQRRYLKHSDAPPNDTDGWETYAQFSGFGGGYLYRKETSERELVHKLLTFLLSAVESAPNRWFRIVLYGESGYEGPERFVSDGLHHSYMNPIHLLGPYCKEKEVMPELEKAEDGLLIFPINPPEGVFIQIEYDPDKPDLDGKMAPKLENMAVPTGTQIVMLDEWGLEVVTTEVI